MERIGNINIKYLKEYNIEIDDNNIYVHSGTFKHIEKRHPDIKNPHYIIENVLKAPDYYGQNPKETNTLEFIKKINENYLVAIKIDVKTEKLIVASTYKITESKLLKMIQNNRIKKFSEE